MSLLKSIFSEIKTVFKESPQRFFTEHDIHSELASHANSLLGVHVPPHERTLDGFIVDRIHHEYPTRERMAVRKKKPLQ